MSVKLQYVGQLEYNNPKLLVFKATFVGTYGVNGTGDLLDLLPSQNQGVDGGISDPKSAYNDIIGEPPTIYGVINNNIGGSYCAIKPNAVPTMTNFGLIMYEPGGLEKASAAAYTAPELAGDVFLIFNIPGLQ